MISTCVPPLFNKLTRDRPYTGAWEDISVEHTQFQLELCLLQLPDHLDDEFKVVLAVADEGIKHFWVAWIQFSTITVNNTS